jgi:uncharacterized protein YcfJ
MKRLSATLLAIGLVAAVGSASAQSSGNYGSDPYRNSNYGTSQAGSNQGYSNGYASNSGAVYDYARVVRVDPVIGSSYGYGSTTSSNPRCYDTTDSGGYASDQSRDGYYGNDPYRRDGYGNDPYYPQQSGYGTDTGRTVATVLGGIAGAVLGSKVGGGSGAYAATAIGSMVGGMAGRQVYESTQRNRAQRGNVRVCDPVPVSDGYSTSRTANDGRVDAYNVTYEYAGRQFTTRTNYHPGDRIRVRVDVRPE